MSKAPIEEGNYIMSPVVDIGDVRVARGLTRRAISSCKHNYMIYDSQERRVWCKDCEQEIDGFDAMLILIGQHQSAWQKIKKEREIVSEAIKFSLRRIATKEIDKVWRTKNMLPCCPSCNAGLLPEDFKNGVMSRVSREYEAKRRERQGGTTE